MADQERSDFYVDFTMILCALKSQELSIILLSDLIQVSDHRSILSVAILSQPVNISLVSYQTQKLRQQSIMVKLRKSPASPGLPFLG